MFIWQRIGGNSRRDEHKTENSPQKDGNNTRQTRRDVCVCVCVCVCVGGVVNWISWARKQERDAVRRCQRSARTEGGLKRRLALDLTVRGSKICSLVRNVSCFAMISHFFGWSVILRTAGISCKNKTALEVFTWVYQMTVIAKTGW